MKLSQNVQRRRVYDYGYVAVTAEECCNGQVSQIAVTDQDVVDSEHEQPARSTSDKSRILFAVNSNPPWHIVTAYALQVGTGL